MNERIRAPEVRLVGPSGEQVGAVRMGDAPHLVKGADLDLVEMTLDVRSSVCKLMDYGKLKHESTMKTRDTRHGQANTQLKEVRFRLKIDGHDYVTKRGYIERFLKGGDRVKYIIRSRGRERFRPKLGIRFLQGLAEEMVELGTIGSYPCQDGHNMVMVLIPVRKKAEVKPDQCRRREEVRAARRVEKHMGRVPRDAKASDGAPAGENT